MADTQPASPVPTLQPQRATRYQVRGVSPVGLADFFGPGQPMYPMGPPQLAGRRLDYDVAENIRITPRQNETLTYFDLVQLAETHDVTRVCIETRKDQMESLEFNIKPRGSSGKAGRDAEQQYRIDKLEDLFKYPDGENDFSTWQRELMEQCLVIDAASIYVDRRTKGSTFFEVIDGATIKRVIDMQGRTPVPEDGPAYQQIIHGMPAWDMWADELVYAPRNKRANRLYGCSPVQQIFITVNIALRRQSSILQYFTEGNIPDAFATVPEGWTAQQIIDAQESFDALYSGNLGARRHMKFIPGGSRYYPTREIILKSDFDEWLARIASFAFSIAPTWLAKTTSRGQGQTLAEAAVIEGLFPYMRWFRGLMNKLIQSEDTLGQHDLEMEWEERQDADPDTRDKIWDRKIRRGQATLNEGRAVEGLDPIQGGDTAMIYVGQGPVPVKDAVKFFENMSQQPKPNGSGPAQSTNQPRAKPAQAKPKGPMPKPNGRPDQTGVPQKRPPNQKGEVAEGGEIPFGVTKGEKKTLYVRRDLLNAEEFIDWAKSQGFDTTLPADDIHVTVLFSKAPVDWSELTDSFDLLHCSGMEEARSVEPLGDKGAVVLKFQSQDLANRHDEFVNDFGASHDYDSYQAHVTITYKKPDDLDLEDVEPFQGTLEFGPEIFEEVNSKWLDNIKEAADSVEHSPIPLESETITTSEDDLQNALMEAFEDLAPKAAKVIVGAAERVQKADPDDEKDENGIPLADVPAYKAALDAVETLSLDELVALIDPVQTSLLVVGDDAATKAIASLGVEITPSGGGSANQLVISYAEQRSAELIGKKFVDGKLVDNPDAQWVITEPTRDMLRETITQSFQQGLGVKGLAKEIEESYAFSAERALVIARSETLKAHGQGALAGYLEAREAGIHLKKSWLPAPDACPVCLENADAGPIELEEEFPSGDQAPSAHPNCRCALIPVLVNEG